MQVSKKVSDALDKAKFDIITSNKSVFLSTILFSLKFQWSDKLPTAGVNELELMVNPDFFINLSEKERVGLLCHEAWHVAFNHIIRGDHYDSRKWNEAADHVINLMLLDNGYELPEGGLHDPQYADMDTNTVYKLLPNKPADSPPLGGCGTDILPPKQNAKAAEQTVKELLTKAATRAKLDDSNAGSIPGEIEVLIDELINPKLPWQHLLQNYMDSFSKEDYSYRRPNRRYMPEYYLPSMYDEAIGEIAIAVDTSGSVSDEQFRMFLSEINAIKQKMNPKIITLIDFDTSIKAVHTLEEGDSVLSVPFSGRGGTNLQPVFDHFDKHSPVVLIVFSDLWCQKIVETPAYPVLWICVDNEDAEVNFGIMVHYDTTI